MKREVRLGVLLIAGLVLPAPLQAAPFVVGQVFASVGDGTVKVFNPDGTLAQTLTYPGGGEFNTGSAFDAAGNFYVTDFNTNTVKVFDSNGTFVTSFATGGTANESIVVDQAQNLYIGHAGFTSATAPIEYRTTSGVLIDSDEVAVGPRGTDWIDLAADQTTMYYTSEGSEIRRFDVATDTQLTSFATGLTGGACFALRILSDGGVLVACSSVIHRLDATGMSVQTYDIGGFQTWFALNLDPDGTSFWTGDITGSGGLIARFDIATGALLTSFSSVPLSQLAGLSVFGEITQATGGGTGDGDGDGTVPEPASVLLLGTAIAGLNAFRKRVRPA